MNKYYHFFILLLIVGTSFLSTNSIASSEEEDKYKCRAIFASAGAGIGSYVVPYLVFAIAQNEDDKAVKPDYGAIGSILYDAYKGHELDQQASFIQKHGGKIGALLGGFVGGVLGALFEDNIIPSFKKWNNNKPTTKGEKAIIAGSILAVLAGGGLGTYAFAQWCRG
ncbi:MAG: hypothetical protein BGO77_00495 [Caedibacter sp. 37-49]|nr:MAG: hypothetical protein BGO77_00495 [Caedibacter sp. 37-49]